MSDILFLKILSAALKGEPARVCNDTTYEQWRQAFDLALIHKVLPLIIDSCADIYPFDKSELAPLLDFSKLTVSRQVIKNISFVNLYPRLSARHLSTLTVKGIICRSVYPKPDLRESGDEDMYVLPEDTLKTSRALTEAGFIPKSPDPDAGEQCSYVAPDGLCIELHKSLFPQTDYFEKYNKVFESCFENSVEEEFNGTLIRTLCPTEHLLYLILHAAKHFLHSGVGIRQVCDIVMFSQHYGKRLDWDYIYDKCLYTDTLIFASALFDIGRKHLGMSFEKACISQKWQKLQVNGDELLDDILDAGVYGSSSAQRSHSAGITLGAVHGKKRRVLRSVFPSAKDMGRRFAYVKKHPVLLPVAWGQRIIEYSKEIAHSEGKNDALSAVKTGQKRVELLKIYGFTKKV